MGFFQLSLDKEKLLIFLHKDLGSQVFFSLIMLKFFLLSVDDMLELLFFLKSTLKDVFLLLNLYLLRVNLLSEICDHTIKRLEILSRRRRLNLSFLLR